MIFQAKSKSAQNLIDESVIKFTLNIEQQRAFRIIANHAVTPQCEQLKMNLGGMGGTGKSQVIKALKHFLSREMSLIESYY
jgi:Mg-chelatase subunit ChlI